ncbi:MAG: hypothetical protein WDA75_19700 [Candidatus Latescibacterota bacterium]|jgi:hypothetical protein
MTDDNAAGYAMVAKYRMLLAELPTEFVVASGFSLVRVRQRLLFAYVFRRYQDPQDIAWVRETSRTWARAIVSANQATDPAPPPASGRLPGMAGRLGRIASKGLTGAMVGAVLAVVGTLAVLGARRRRRGQEGPKAVPVPEPDWLVVPKKKPLLVKVGRISLAVILLATVVPAVVVCFSLAPNVLLGYTRTSAVTNLAIVGGAVAGAGLIVLILMGRRFPNPISVALDRLGWTPTIVRELRRFGGILLCVAMAVGILFAVAYLIKLILG